MSLPWKLIGKLIAVLAGVGLVAVIGEGVTPEIRRGEPSDHPKSTVAAIDAQPHSGKPVSTPSTAADLRSLLRFFRTADRASAARLRRMALGNRDPLVAGNAIRALARLGLVARDRELLALVDDPRLRVRQELVLALGDSGAPEAVAPLAVVLADPNPAIRPLVIHALRKIGGPRADALLVKIRRDPHTTRTERVFAEPR